MARHNALAQVLGDILAAVFGATVDTTTGATQYAVEDGRRVDLSYHVLAANSAATAVDFTVLLPWAHELQAQDSAASLIKRHGDDEKIKKHA